MTTPRTCSVATALAASFATLVFGLTVAAPASVLAQDVESDRKAPAADARRPTSGTSRSASGASAGVVAPAGGRTPVPILMYHVIADPPAGAPYPELYVRARDFASQMRWLGRHGYQPVTLRAVWDHWHRGAPLPKRPIVVSFDDGYRSVAHIALPRMRERRWPGVLNLTVKNLRGRGGLSPRQVRRLISAGWEIDAHSLTHPDLTALDDRQLAHEVAGSRIELRRRFGVPVSFFCYPAGRFDARVIAAVRHAGYLGATTTLDGLATPSRPYELRRVRVSRSDGLAGFAARIERLRGSVPGR
ncbi:MAG TPA: polysaccharide deacetylase family protein [Gaiellaceae bacterium]|nr:polysaccharide deacetylase family protein [Gaiellaceae bacterium]